jgi:hypothetical protein
MAVWAARDKNPTIATPTRKSRARKTLVDSAT